MKKVCMFCICLLSVSTFIGNTAMAKEQTLNELLSAAEANRKAYENAKNQKALSEQEKAAATKEKEQVQAQIASISTEIKQIEEDVEALQKEIDKKDDEIKQIMKFVQVSEGQSTYLEYIFGASSFTDFIYRVSVAEQLSNYNNKLIEEYNTNVKDLEKKQNELNSKQQQLTTKEQELSTLEAKLTSQIETLQEGMLSKDTEYKIQISTINTMKNRGCKGTDTLSSCQRKVSGNNGNGNLASTSAAYIPVASGYISSDYGWRKINGKSEYHTGIDFSASTGTTVYPVADGEVVATVVNSRCGNHMIYVKHNINGHSYVTSYWHLSTFLVTGGKVTTNTPIGRVAAPASVTGDNCGGGSHVHLNLFDNAGGKWEASASRGAPNSGRIDPRTAFPNIPKPKSDGNGGYIALSVSHSSSIK